MAISTSSRPSQSFDLADLADMWDKASRFRRLFLLGGAGMCTAFALAGVYLLLSSLAETLSPRDLGYWILVVGFGLVAVYGLKLAPQVGPACRRLVLDDHDLRFEAGARGRTRHLAWLDPAFELEVYDRSELPTTERDGTPRFLDFIVRLRHGPRTPLSRAAFEAILEGARSHGLEVLRRPTQDRGDPAGGSLVTISARRSSQVRSVG